MRIIGYLLLTFLCIHANANTCEALFEQAFNKGFFDHKNVYEKGFCCINIRDLLNQFVTQEHLDIQNAKVFYIVYDSRRGTLEESKLKRTLKPVAARSLESNYWGWMFHVVLVQKGNVYDLDFQKKPNVVKAAEYFQKMFVGSKAQTQNPLETIFVREIPALEYLSQYSEGPNSKFDSNYYRFKAEEYPLQSLNMYLTKQQE